MILHLMRSHDLINSHHVVSTVNSCHEFFKTLIFLTVLINVRLDFRCHIGKF